MGEEGLLGKIYKGGDVIVKEGTKSREMYVVQSGNVQVTKGCGDEEAVLATLNEGEIFGEMSLLDAKPRSATVKAVGEARVLAIDHDTFLRRVSKDPTLALRILRQMGHRIREMNTMLSTTQDKLKKVQVELDKLREDFPARADMLNRALDELKTVLDELARLKDSFQARTGV